MSNFEKFLMCWMGAMLMTLWGHYDMDKNKLIDSFIDLLISLVFFGFMVYFLIVSIF